MATHKRALREVRERTVVFDPGLGCEGGFKWATGQRIDNYNLLVELWSARRRGLIHVDGGVVLLAREARQS